MQLREFEGELQLGAFAFQLGAFDLEFGAFVLQLGALKICFLAIISLI